MPAARDAPRRGRGTRAGLDRARIVEAARGLDPDAITMQSVADALGVDRKAVNYHVTDRESLLELTAIDAFVEQSSRTRIPPEADWREACRLLAVGMRDSIIATGVLVAHMRMTTQRHLGAAGPADAVLAKLQEAGFDEETAARGLHLLTTICIGFARDVVMARREGSHPQVAELRRALAESPGGFEALRHLFDADIDTYDDAQFEFSLTAFFHAMEALPRKDSR